MPPVYASLAALLYAAALLLQRWSIFPGQDDKSRSLVRLMRISGGLALLLHGFALGSEMIRPEGLRLGLFNMFSLICGAVVLLVLLSSLTKPLQNLLLALFPLAAASILLNLAVSDSYLARELPVGLMVHIVVAILAYSVISIATLQALFLRYADRKLKDRTDSRLLAAMPPLQTMEALLFELLVTGLILLSLAIGSGFVFLTDIMDQRLVHHTVLTLASWVVFALLLFGHWRRGWRGSTAISLTLAGYGLLVLGYFGSKLVMELILG